MPRPSKPKPSNKTRGEEIALIGGEVSGIPDSLAKAIASLRDVERRCEAARAVAGILSEPQASLVTTVAGSIVKMIPYLESFQHSTHEMHMAGIGLPKVEPEMDLL